MWETSTRQRSGKAVTQCPGVVFRDHEAFLKDTNHCTRHLRGRSPTVPANPKAKPEELRQWGLGQQQAKPLLTRQWANTNSSTTVHIHSTFADIIELWTAIGWSSVQMLLPDHVHP